MVRKRRGRTALGGEGQWEYLVGDPQGASAAEPATSLRESSVNPIFTRKDVRNAFQWRIRNLTYPKEVYSVTLDANDRTITIRTSNKKYYKRFNIPEMDQLKLPLDARFMTWTHNNNTLIISYAKPPQVMAAEEEDLELARKTRAGEDLETDNCKQQ